MRLYECDLLTLQDGPRCRLDAQTLRGFCDERDGYFRLEPVIIGTQVVVNAYTNVCPGASIADGAVHGLDASSYENPSEKSYTAYNRKLLFDPSWLLRILYRLFGSDDLRTFDSGLSGERRRLRFCIR